MFLKRDSFFTGVQEGSIGAERIIQMLNVFEDELVVEEKAIYSLESFLNARRIMYWQVYLHKTSISAEKMLIQIIKRAKYLTQQGIRLEATPAFKIFLEREIDEDAFFEDPDLLDVFMSLDDTDIWGSIKFWTFSDDPVLNMLSTMLLKRKLFRISLHNEKIDKGSFTKFQRRVSEKYKLSSEESRYFVAKGSVTNEAYVAKNKSIKVLMKNNEVLDLVAAVDLPNIKAMSKIVKKYYLCWPKDVSLMAEI
jgi:hypothetical protein